jgi:hypothetical protein
MAFWRPKAISPLMTANGGTLGPATYGQIIAGR